MKKHPSVTAIEALYDRHKPIPALEPRVIDAARNTLQSLGYAMVGGFVDYDPGITTINTAIGQGGLYASVHAEGAVVGPHATVDEYAFGIWHQETAR